MSKINTKVIVFSLGILAILVFVLIFVPFNKAAAAYGTNINYQTIDNSYYNIDNPKPSINLINPKSSNIGVGTKTITITGSGFVPSSVARVNGSNRPTTFIDDSHLLVQINGNDTYTYRTNGGFFISVFNGAPGGGYSNAAFFTINNVTVPIIINTNNNNNSPDTFSDTTQTQTTNPTSSTSNDTNSNYSSLASNAIFGSNSFLPSGLIQWIILAIIILLIVILVRKFFGAREHYDALPMKYD